MKGKTLSIRSIIVIVFILILTVSICCIASFIIMNWISSSRYAMGEMSDCINRSIRVRVESFLQSSENMEKLSRGAIDRSVIDGFNDFLVEAVGEYEGLAFIVESGTEKVVANSLHIDNYEIGRDGTLKIYEINEIDNATLVRIY